MPFILVAFSAKRIAILILLIEKLNGRIYFFWQALFEISFIPARNYLFKVSNWSTRITCENCSRLRMKILELCQRRHSSAFIVNCKHISSFALIVEFERANVCGAYIEKTCLRRQDLVYHALCCSIFSVNKLY